MTQDEFEEKAKGKLIKYSIFAVVGLIVFLIINPFVTVGASERGILLNWGAPSDTILQPGLHLKWPIAQSIKTVSIQPVQLDHKIEVGKDGAITKDLQTFGASLTIFYKYKPDQIVSMYKNYGEDKMNSIINQTLRQIFKTEAGNYQIYDLPATQPKVQANVYAAMVAAMANYPVDITEFKLVNYDWSDEFDAQIKATMERAQQVKQKEQELLIAQNEQQKKVKEAEAEKTALITKAEGEKEKARLDAEAKALEGDGIRKYNESVAKNWDIELKKVELEIEKIKAERWDGKYVSTNNYGPIPLQNGSILGK